MYKGKGSLLCNHMAVTSDQKLESSWLDSSINKSHDACKRIVTALSHACKRMKTKHFVIGPCVGNYVGTRRESKCINATSKPNLIKRRRLNGMRPPSAWKQVAL